MTRNSPAPNSDPRSLRRSVLGLLIVGFLAAHLMLLGSNQCPVRPGEQVGFARSERIPADLRLLAGTGDRPPAERTAK
jgi:hypothetical protein